MKDTSKEFLQNEISSLEEYLSNTPAGTEDYQNAFEQYTKLNSMLEKKRLNIKWDTILHAVEIGILAIGSIIVPLKLGELAYKKEEEEEDYKNGTIWSLATKKTK